MMNKQVLPITPEQAEEQQLNSIPDFVIEAVNGLIVKKYRREAKCAVLRQDEIIEAIQNVEFVERDVIIKNRWLDFEDLYRQAGWSVDYDTPGYNESYTPVFTFTKKK